MIDRVHSPFAHVRTTSLQRVRPALRWPQFIVIDGFHLADVAKQFSVNSGGLRRTAFSRARSPLEVVQDRLLTGAAPT